MRLSRASADPVVGQVVLIEGQWPKNGFDVSGVLISRKFLKSLVNLLFLALRRFIRANAVNG